MPRDKRADQLDRCPEAPVMATRAELKAAADRLGATVTWRENEDLLRIEAEVWAPLGQHWAATRTVIVVATNEDEDVMPAGRRRVAGLLIEDIGHGLAPCTSECNHGEDE